MSPRPGANRRIRALLIAENCDPDRPAIPVVGYCHSDALRQVVDAHVVTQARNREVLSQAGWKEGADFTALDTEIVARPLRQFGAAASRVAGWTAFTAINLPAYYYFEHRLWKHFGSRLMAREFDLVHRVTPLTPTYPSIIAKRCAKLGIPFVLGPLNGGLPYPKGYADVQRSDREWLWYLRNAYRALPYYASTLDSSAAIIVGSVHTLRPIKSKHRNKCIYIPENGIDPSRFTPSGPAPRSPSGPLRAIFVGRLVPLKGADIVLEAAAPLLRNGALRLKIVGDGPEMARLRTLTKSYNIETAVTFSGWVPHRQVRDHLGHADILVFPSIREFGGGVILEAMTMQVPPIVVDYGGPGEIVTPTTGFKIPLGPRPQLVADLRTCLSELCRDPQNLSEIGPRARQRVLEKFTWTAKAKQMLEIYRWVLGGRANKPDFGMPF